MYLSRRKLISIVSTSLIVIAFAVAPATMRAQNPDADIKSDPVEVKLDPALIRVNKRAPIPFKPFDTVDPNTGKRVSPDTIVTLPNGRKLTAGELKRNYDQLELELVKTGHSLRRPDTLPFQVTPVPGALAKQAQAIRAAQIPNSTFRSFDVQAAEKEQKTMIAAPRINVPDTILNNAKPFHFTRNWNESLGNPSVFSAFTKGHITLDGAKDLTTLDGEASAGGSIFSNTFDLMHVTGNLRAPRSGKMNATIAVRLAGISVFNLNESVNTSFTKTGSLQKTLDKSVSFHVSVGPVPISVKLGAQGAAGVTYAVAVAPIRASANFGPFVHTKVYAQVGVDLLVAGAGAEANLTLLNTDGNLRGAVSIEGTNYKWSDSYSQSLDMLSGKVSVFAFIYLPCLDIPPVCRHQSNWEIFSFAGFKTTGTLFNDSKTMDFTQPLVFHQ